MTKRALGVLMTVLVMGAGDLAAQRGGRGGQRAEMEQRIQARFDDMVREELGLSDDQMAQLQGAVEDFRVRRLDFTRRERNSRMRVARLGAAAGGQELTEEEASEILAEMLALSGEEADLFRQEQEAFLQVLSAPQVVRFIVMRQQLGDRIRNVRGRGGAARGRGQQSGRGGGPF